MAVSAVILEHLLLRVALWLSDCRLCVHVPVCAALI